MGRREAPFTPRSQHWTLGVTLGVAGVIAPEVSSREQ